MVSAPVIVCPVCGQNRVPEQQQRFCRSCGYEFVGDDLIDDEELVLDIKKRENSSVFIWAVRVALRLAVYAFAILTIVTIFTPTGRRRGNSELAREKACYANMRVLLGAIEMYNMDQSVSITIITPDDLNRLVHDGYLKGELSPPTPECSYSSTGDMTGRDGRVTCAVHGTVEKE